MPNISRILFFDVETTGLVNNRLPIGDPSQPHIVQIAAQLCDDAGRILGGFSFVVNPGVPIPDVAAKIHGITDQVAHDVGVPPLFALEAFARLYRCADLLVAHNIKFDRVLMDIAIHRHRGVAANRLDKPLFCTMEAASPIVGLPPTPRMKAAGFDKPKPPKLEEAILHFFGERLDGAHDAMVDVIACRRVFFKLRELGVGVAA